MTASEYMDKANILLRRIKRKRREADKIRITESFPDSPVYNDMPKNPNPNPHQKAEKIERAIDLDREADDALAELEELKNIFQTALKALDSPDDRDMLYKRYIEFKSWKKVADEIGYSESHTKKLHSIAVKKLILDDTP